MRFVYGALFTLALAVALATSGPTGDASGRQAPRAAATLRAQNVIVVTLDGLRWQEFFGGAERALFGKDADKADPPTAVKRFWRDTPEARRAALMPFMWEVVARTGQVFGDPSKNSLCHVTNGVWFSYPGYAEMLSGVADPRVDSNNKVNNPNVTVLEWLNGRPGFQGRVASFGAWDVLPFILAVERSKLPVGDGYPPVPNPRTDRERAINDMAGDLAPIWEGAPLDAPIMHAAIECLRTRKPRVLYVLLGETDEWAHEPRYDLYLDAAWRGDRFIRRLWDMAQSMPDYKGRTALVVAVDHGRGATTRDWTDHGRKVPAAERTWIAVMGPDTPPLGLRENVTVTTAQVAATIAALAGEDYRRAVPAAAPALAEVIRGR
jgi:hypothetical protein